jgi:hypothetical protein
MKLFKKFQKIQVQLRERRRDRKGKPISIEVKEKEYFICQNCHNRYNSFHVYCPQCLGMLQGNITEPAILKITSVPRGKEEEIAHTLKTLSGQKPFDFRKALQSLPWVMIRESEPEILREWQDSLLPLNVKAEVERAPESRKKILRQSAPLFPTRAPLPSFFAPVTDAGIRQVAGAIKNASIRLKWVEAVLSAFRIVQGFYKGDSYNRILFFDFLLQIDNDLQEGVKEFERVAKVREENFVVVIDRIQTALKEMQAEMEEVQHQVNRTLLE